MRIEFRKITSNASPFEIKKSTFISRGTFRKLSQKLVELDFHLYAPTMLVCDRCGNEYLHKMDKKISLKVSDGAFEGEDLDVIEYFDHYVDFDAIMLSEIEAEKSDYHFCPNCKNQETTGE